MEQQGVHIKIQTIELLSKSMSQRPASFEDVPSEFSFDIHANTSLNPKGKLIITVVDVTIREKDNEQHFAHFKVGLGFEIGNFESVIVQKDHSIYDIPSDLDVLVKTVAISTTRGIIFSELRGTYLYNAILPVILLPQPTVQEDSVLL